MPRYRRSEGLPLVDFAHEYNLLSTLPVGTITWEQPIRGLSSTIDVILTSWRLFNRLCRCGVHEYDHGSDHRPITVWYDTKVTNRSSNISRLLPEKADWPQIGPEVAERLERLNLPRKPTSSDLDTITDEFMGVVSEVVQARVPRARPSPYAKRWWTSDLSSLREMLTSARNRATTLRRRGEETTEAWQAFQRARSEYFRQIERQKRGHWKAFVSDPSNLWKANKYTSVTGHSRDIPTLVQGETTAETNEAKAAMLMNAFFPTPPEPEVQPGRRGALSVLARRVPRKLPPITIEEAREAIFRYNPKKAPGLCSDQQQDGRGRAGRRLRQVRPA